MSGHTPGPWSADMVLHRPINKAFSARLITDSEGNNIAIGSSWMDTPETMKEAEANANLIAAAPDLLEALEGLMDNEHQSAFEHWLAAERPSGGCEYVQSQWIESSEYSDFADLYCDELAAIARAKGEK